MNLKEFYETEYLPEWINQRLRPGTVAKKLTAFEKYILPMFGVRELDSFKLIDWTRFENLLRNKRKLGNKTIRNHQSDLQHILRKAVAWGHIASFPPIEMVKAIPAAPKPLQYNERDAFIAALVCEPLHYRSMAIFALATGMRVGELRGLRWKDFEQEETSTGRIEVVKIQRSVSGRFNQTGETKSGRHRVIPLNADALMAKDLIYSGQELSVFVFSKPDKPFVPLTYKAVDCAIKRICRNAGIKAVGWHTLRHTVCSMMLARNVSVFKARDVMGHVDIRTTMGYVKVRGFDLLSAVETLNQ